MGCEPSMILAGHRNPTVADRAVRPGLVQLATGQSLGWTSVMHATNSPTLFTDCHVEIISRLWLTTNHLATNLVNRLAVP